jgi:AcrR family transcriptional regulator
MANGGTSSQRRQELTEAALEYVLTHGLLALSLRPLAASLGTSDRMIIYHFGSKAQLIADVVELANHRLSASVTVFDEPSRSVRQVVDRAWQLMTSPQTDPLARLYLELCALSVRNPGSWSDAHGRLRQPWLSLLGDNFITVGLPASRARVLARLVLDALDGLMLDRLVTGDTVRVDAAVHAFARLVARQR